MGGFLASGLPSCLGSPWKNELFSKLQQAHSLCRDLVPVPLLPVLVGGTARAGALWSGTSWPGGRVPGTSRNYRGRRSEVSWAEVCLIRRGVSPSVSYEEGAGDS